MSSQSLEKTEIIILSFNDYKEDSINFNKILIPFSKFAVSKSTQFIYKGLEKMIFKERHSIYKTILLDEFSEV